METVHNQIDQSKALAILHGRNEIAKLTKDQALAILNEPPYELGLSVDDLSQMEVGKKKIGAHLLELLINFYNAYALEHPFVEDPIVEEIEQAKAQERKDLRQQSRKPKAAKEVQEAQATIKDVQVMQDDLLAKVNQLSALIDEQSKEILFLRGFREAALASWGLASVQVQQQQQQA